MISIISPPIKLALDGNCLIKTHAQSGPKTASSKTIRLTSGAGRYFGPRLISPKDKGRIINPCNPTQSISSALILSVGAIIKLMIAIIKPPVAMVRLMLVITDFLRTTSEPAQLAAANTAAKLPIKFPLLIPFPKIIAMPIIVIKIAMTVVFDTGSLRKINAKLAAKRGEIVIRNNVLATFVFTIAVTKKIEEIANKNATAKEAITVSRLCFTKYLLIVFFLCLKTEYMVRVIAIKNPRQNNIVQVSALINVVRRPSGVSTITPQTTIKIPFVRELSLKKIINYGISNIFILLKQERVFDICYLIIINAINSWERGEVNMPTSVQH